MECFSSSSSTGSSQNRPSISSQGQEAGTNPPRGQEAWHCCSTCWCDQPANSFNHLAVTFATCPNIRGRALSVPHSPGITGTQAATHSGSWGVVGSFTSFSLVPHSAPALHIVVQVVATASRNWLVLHGQQYNTHCKDEGNTLKLYLPEKNTVLTDYMPHLLEFD